MVTVIVDVACIAPPVEVEIELVGVGLVGAVVVGVVHAVLIEIVVTGVTPPVGIVIGLFLIYHLMHFTIQVTNPEISAANNVDAMGRPDVFMMVVLSLQDHGIVALYALGVIALGLHLFHGIQSSFQTWGLNNDRSFPVVTRGGMIAAVVVFLGYAAIPVVIVAGLLQ